MPHSLILPGNPANTYLWVGCPNWGLNNGGSGPYGVCPALPALTSANNFGNNNGNLQSVTASTAPTPAPFASLSPITQNFTYDGVNRVKTATDNGSGTPLERDFSYDAYGNMWITRSDTGLLPTSLLPVPTAQSAYNAATNRFAASSNIAYDNAGHQTTIGPYSFTYDAENHQYSETNTAGSAGANYVYDAAGSLSAEYTTGANLAGCQTCYLSYDHLGSTRMVTDEVHNVVERHDYMPFGEEIPSGYSGRGASPWGATSGIVNQKFTGKERDPESGLDYFGARYYGSALGRWTSPDWSDNPEPVPYANLSDPQTLNLYSYTRNNPLSKTDSDGHCTVDGENHWGWCILHDLGVYKTQKDKDDEQKQQIKIARWYANVYSNTHPRANFDPSKHTDEEILNAYHNGSFNQFSDEDPPPDPFVLLGMVAGPIQGPITKDQARFAEKNNLNPDSEYSREVLQNLDSTVENFVSKYRKAGITRELGDEMMKKTVREAIKDGGSKVRKLLIDSRFAK